MHRVFGCTQGALDQDLQGELCAQLWCQTLGYAIRWISPLAVQRSKHVALCLMLVLCGFDPPHQPTPLSLPSSLPPLPSPLGLMDMLAGSVLRCPLELNNQLLVNSPLHAPGRELLQTDLSTTNPASTACGNSVFTVDVQTGASLAIDTSCTWGTAAFDVEGTTSDYTISFEATGAVTIHSGGLLVMNTITATSNVWSISSTLSVSGSIELLVTDTSSAGDVLLIKWDDTSCTDITSSVVIYGCTTCTVSVLASGSGTSCYLRLSIPSTATLTSNSDNMLWLLLLLLLLPVCGIVLAVWQRTQRTTDLEVLSYPPLDEVCHYDQLVAVHELPSVAPEEMFVSNGPQEMNVLDDVEVHAPQIEIGAWGVSPTPAESFPVFSNISG